MICRHLAFSKADGKKLLQAPPGVVSFMKGISLLRLYHQKLDVCPVSEEQRKALEFELTIQNVLVAPTISLQCQKTRFQRDQICFFASMEVEH